MAGRKFKSRAEYEAFMAAQQAGGPPRGPQQPSQQQQQQQQRGPQQQQAKPEPQSMGGHVMSVPASTDQASMAARMSYVAASAFSMNATVLCEQLPYFAEAPTTTAQWKAPVGTLRKGDVVMVHHPQTVVGGNKFMYFRDVNPLTAEAFSYYLPLEIADDQARLEAGNLPQGPLVSKFCLPGTYRQS